MNRNLQIRRLDFGASRKRSEGNRGIRVVSYVIYPKNAKGVKEIKSTSKGKDNFWLQVPKHREELSKLDDKEFWQSCNEKGFRLSIKTP